MNYLILITEEGKAVLEDCGNFYQFKEGDNYLEVKKLLNQHYKISFDLIKYVGQTFPLPTGYKVSFEEQAKKRKSRFKVDLWFDTEGVDYSNSPFYDTRKLAILSKLEEEKVVAPSEEIKQGWISVKDRLPEKEDRYLTYQDDGCYVMSYYNNEIDGSNWLMDGFTHFPTHWTSLPSPPINK